VFGRTGYVGKLAIRPDVAASISSDITLAACFDHRSEVKSLLLQPRKLHFTPDRCHRCSDARGPSACSPFVQVSHFGTTAIWPSYRLLSCSVFFQDQLHLLRSGGPTSFANAVIAHQFCDSLIKAIRGLSVFCCLGARCFHISCALCLETAGVLRLAQF